MSSTSRSRSPGTPRPSAGAPPLGGSKWSIEVNGAVSGESGISPQTSSEQMATSWATHSLAARRAAFRGPSAPWARAALTKSNVAWQAG